MWMVIEHTEVEVSESSQRGEEGVVQHVMHVGALARVPRQHATKQLTHTYHRRTYGIGHTTQGVSSRTPRTLGQKGEGREMGEAPRGVEG
jgi:hypothetical protein